MVPPLPVTEVTRSIWLNGVHGKCRIIFYYLKWIAIIYFNTLIDENNWYMMNNDCLNRQVIMCPSVTILMSLRYHSDPLTLNLKYNP